MPEPVRKTDKNHRTIGPGGSGRTHPEPGTEGQSVDSLIEQGYVQMRPWQFMLWGAGAFIKQWWFLDVLVGGVISLLARSIIPLFCTLGALLIVSIAWAAAAYLMAPSVE